MLIDEIITRRLDIMASQKDPSDILWPENCAGSRKALVIFIGPSPGGKKEDKRRAINRNFYTPLWNETYDDPLNWSRGFKTSYKPIVEAIIGKPYAEAAKLVARFNMDWQGNPESQDVSYRYMWEGCLYILPVLYECSPRLIVPMDEKSFGVLQIALFNDGYEIIPARIGEVKVKISTKKRKTRYHNSIMAFSAQKKECAFLVIKSLQHPARVYDAEYARRIGQAIREAAIQIQKDDYVNLFL
jgi:hypothetical protein